MSILSSIRRSAAVIHPNWIDELDQIKEILDESLNEFSDQGQVLRHYLMDFLREYPTRHKQCMCMNRSNWKKDNKRKKPFHPYGNRNQQNNQGFKKPNGGNKPPSLSATTFKCYNCGGQGHTAKFCWSAANNSGNQQNAPQQKPKNSN